LPFPFSLNEIWQSIFLSLEKILLLNQNQVQTMQYKSLSQHEGNCTCRQIVQGRFSPNVPWAWSVTTNCGNFFSNSLESPLDEISPKMSYTSSWPKSDMPTCRRKAIQLKFSTDANSDTWRDPHLIVNPATSLLQYCPFNLI
jgi:hypothetical protein